MQRIHLKWFLTVLLAFIALAASAQTKTVNGVVLDDMSLGVPGAYVLVKGETRGVLTDKDGKFSISVKPTDVLVAQFLGFNDQEVPVGDQSSITIKLEPQADMLDEVVMVAYGAQRKASVVGAISTINNEALKAPIGQLSTGLAGKLAGVVAMQRTGEPGESAEFWIRGVNTFGANSTPLILVDGVERSMDLVDPEDIASFSILKDATATALYGVRGANGIVLITTRRGNESKPKINVKMETGLIAPTRLPKMASTAQFIDYYNEIMISENSPKNLISDYARELYLSGEDPYLYPSVDWIKTIFKERARNSRVNMNVTGGTKNVRYYVGGSYYFEDGIFNTVANDRYDAQMNFNKFNFRSNVDINITKSTILALSLSTQFTTKHTPGGSGGDINYIYQYALRNSPIAMPLYYDKEHLSNVTGTENPYNYLNESGYVTRNSNVAQSTISITQNLDMLTEGLSAKVQASWDATNNVTLGRTILPRTYYVTKRDAEGNLIFNVRDDYAGTITLSNSQYGVNVLNIEASMNYDRQFAGAHRVGAMFLFSMRNRNITTASSYIAAFPYKNRGIAGRATYSFKERYFAEFNFGYNGSENFAPGHRFGFFPSFAVGYLISNEPFWEPLKKYVSHLKVRASSGKIGNDQIGGSRRFAYNTTMQSAGGWNFGLKDFTYLPGIATGDVGNPEVSWEEATKQDLGIEINFLNDDLRFQLDFFSDKRDGIFVQRRSIPSAVGINVQQYVNVGRMKNQGFDLSGQYDHIFAQKFRLSLKGNFSFNRNKVLYDDYPPQPWPYMNTAGYAHNQQMGLIAEGLFKDQADIDSWARQDFGTVRPGDIKYRDINGDGVVNEYDVVPIGYTEIPEINYGFGISLGWKGFDASLFFSGVGHVTRIIGGTNLFGGAQSNIKVQGQVFEDVALHHWSPSNPDPDAKYPRLSMSEAQNNSQPSTFWQKDMSFLRLKNAELGYTIPKKITKKAGLETVRLYIQGVNLLTFSKFKLWDPELSSSYGNVYPATKNVSFGLNVNF